MKEAWQDAYESKLGNPPLELVRELLGDLSNKEITEIRQAVIDYDKLEIGEVIFAAFERWAAAEAMQADMSIEEMDREESRYLDKINARDINRKVG